MPTPGPNSDMNFFAYGSLVFGEVMTAVTGRHYESVSATLKGYARYRVHNASYPGLVQSAGDTVGGAFYPDVAAVSVRLLDRFEGEYYARRSISVQMKHNDAVAAETFVFRPEHRHLLSPEEWNREDFRTSHLQAFLDTYKGFSWIQSA